MVGRRPIAPKSPMGAAGVVSGGMADEAATGGTGSESSPEPMGKVVSVSGASIARVGTVAVPDGWK